jgi:hypothetical protein
MYEFPVILLIKFHLVTLTGKKKTVSFLLHLHVVYFCKERRFNSLKKVERVRKNSTILPR